ncbi:MAG: helix-turn-helix protein [Firmicutes bacterium]|nr:helix-turn-helix protein [Bacillota bacterium]
MSFRNNLRMEINKRGWTINDLAAKAGLPARTVKSWISGRNEPTLQRAMKVSNALGIRLVCLLGDK